MQPEPTQFDHVVDQQDLERKRGAVWWGLGAAVVVLAVWLGFLYQTRIQLEDALITYRYAANLAQGEGFVFNPGERVLGTSTPILTLLLALGGLVFGVEHIPLISNVLGLTAGAAMVLAVFALLRFADVGPRWSALTAVVLGVHPTMLWTTTGGMETPLVLFFMAMSLLALARERWTTALVLAALLTLTRPDGGVWAALIGGAVIVRAGKKSVGPLLVFGVLVGAWVIFATVYFGSPVPHSVIAKRTLELTYSARRPWFVELRNYVIWYLENLWLPYSYGFARHQVWGWLVLMLLGMVGIARRAPQQQTIIVLPVFIVALSTAYVLGHSPTFPWYTAPLTWCAVLLGMLGLWELWILFDLYFRKFALQRWVMTASSLLVIFILAASLANRGWVTCRQEREGQTNEDGVGRVVGEWLAQHVRPGEVVATEGIGYQGYYSQCRLIDLAGLLSPQVVEFMRCSRSNAEVFDEIVNKLAPDYIVLRSFEVRENRHFHGGALFATPEQEASFRTHYATAKVFIAPLPDAMYWGEKAELTVYRRRSPPATVADKPAVSPQS